MQLDVSGDSGLGDTMLSLARTTDTEADSGRGDSLMLSPG